MHLMSFGDAFGFLGFMLFMLAMMGFLILQWISKSDKRKGAAKVAGGMAARMGKAWLNKRRKGG
jgi:hypothetical protein